jgi:very-short-patch-repair endonuclease
MAIRMSYEEAKKILGDKLPLQKKPEPPAKIKALQEKTGDPQKNLFMALQKRIPTIIYEQENLIPNRRFKVDIYIPEVSLCIEMDGFAYHRSKTAFQNDRKRQNIFTIQGFKVLRYYTGQLSTPDKIDKIVEEIEDFYHYLLNMDDNNNPHDIFDDMDRECLVF